GRGAGGTGGVLQVGHVVEAGPGVGPGLADLVGDRVGGDHARTLLGGQGAEEAAHPGGRGGGGEDRGGAAVGQHRVQAVAVAGLVRVEQGHGDGAGVDRGEETDDVVQ